MLDQYKFFQMGGFHQVEDQNDNYLAPAVDEIIEMNEEAKKVRYFHFRFSFREGYYI